MDAALGRRSVATLRARFEALRPDGPIPALMAEIPVGHLWPFDEWETDPRPPVSDFHRPDLSYLGWGSVYGPGQTAASPAVSRRCLWLAGPPAALNRLQNAWRDAAGFASAIRGAVGLPAQSGARSAEAHWLWTMFEVAERRVAFSPLQLRSGSVTVAHGICQFPEARVAATRAHPEWDDPLSQIIRAADPGPTRFWDIVDAVEASLMLLDLAEVAMSTLSESGNSSAPAERTLPKRTKGPRGRTASQLLQEWWADPKLRRQLLNAGSSDAIGLLIGKSGPSVREAGPIWDDTIKPRIQGTRSVSRMVREEDRFDV